MKKQIESKRYNTEVSRLIGYGTHKKKVCALYVKRTGECFLLSTDDEIMPISKAEAVDFCKKFNLRSAYSEALCFAENTKKQVTVYMTEAEKMRLSEICDTWKLNISEAIDRMISQTVRKLEKECEERQKALEQLIAEYKAQAEKPST